MRVTGALTCATCGRPIMGSVDLVPGVAVMEVQSDGTFAYAGETEMFWDGQENRLGYDEAGDALRRIAGRHYESAEYARAQAVAALNPRATAGRIVVQCWQGHEWVVGYEPDPEPAAA